MNELSGVYREMLKIAACKIGNISISTRCDLRRSPEVCAKVYDEVWLPILRGSERIILAGFKDGSESVQKPLPSWAEFLFSNLQRERRLVYVFPEVAADPRLREFWLEVGRYSETVGSVLIEIVPERLKVDVLINESYGYIPVSGVWAGGKKYARAYYLRRRKQVNNLFVLPTCIGMESFAFLGQESVLKSFIDRLMIEAGLQEKYTERMPGRWRALAICRPGESVEECARRVWEEIGKLPAY